MLLKRFLIAALSVSLLGLAACASDPRNSFDNSTEFYAETDEAFGGEALVQRKLELGRALTDMQDFLETLASMRERGNEHGFELFRPFLDRYLISHLEPLLVPRWQSQHPELIKFDANLRFIQTEVLIQLEYEDWAEDVIQNLFARYQDRGNMLVEYPMGSQTTLREALDILRDQEWRS